MLKSNYEAESHLHLWVARSKRGSGSVCRKNSKHKKKVRRTSWEKENPDFFVTLDRISPRPTRLGDPRLRGRLIIIEDGAVLDRSFFNDWLRSSKRENL